MNPSINLTSTEISNSTSHLTSLVYTVNVLVLSFNVLFGFPTHVYVIWLIVRGTGNGIAMEFFTLNLSVCEMGTCLNSVFFLFVFCLSLHLSPLTNFLLGLAITGRPLFECLICVERYLAVVHPVTFLKFKPLRYKVMCAAEAWMGCFGCCLIRCFVVIEYTLTEIWFYLIQFLGFLCIQVFCLSAVLRVLKQSGPGERGREEENHMKKRAFHLILVTTVSMGIIYVPFIIVGFFSIIKQTFLKEAFLLPFISFMFAGFVQPVLYLRRVGKLSCFVVEQKNR